jgi:hypothetical protein
MINGLDVLSAWIRNISLNLTRLDLKASHLSAELFWPQHDTTEPPHWPNLLEFDVTTSIECMYSIQSHWIKDYIDLLK